MRRGREAYIQQRRDQAPETYGKLENYASHMSLLRTALLRSRLLTHSPRFTRA